MKKSGFGAVCKAFAAVILAFIMTFSLSSCAGVFSDPKTLMSPPNVSGVLSGIEDALAKSVGTSQFSFVYPMSGNNRSSCITCKIMGDSEAEAIVFYQLKDSGEIHMNYLAKNDGEWKSRNDINLVCTSIDKVDFADLCGSDSRELLIGCNLYNENSKRLYIYRFEKSAFELITQEDYTDFAVCNMTDDENSQIMMFSISAPTAMQNKNVNQYDNSGEVKKSTIAKLIQVSTRVGGNVSVLGSAALDSSITSISAVSESVDSDENKLLFVDANKGSSAMITEILKFDKKVGALENLLYSGALNENIFTKRNLMQNSRDIDGDGKIEIPFDYAVPGSDSKDDEDKLYYSDWRRYNNGRFESVAVGYFNTIDGYFFKTPKGWVNDVTVEQDRRLSELNFYEYDSANSKKGKLLLSIKVFDSSEFSGKKNNYEKVTGAGNSIIAAKAESGSKYSTDMQYVNSNLSVFR